MGLGLSWEIEGEKQLSRNLEILAQKIKDWGPAFKETADNLKNIFAKDVFDTEGGAIQENWSPLKKAYALQKAKKYPGRGTLVATGKMRNSFMTLWRPDMAQVWNSAEYFKYHQSNKPRSKLPRRVMMKIGKDQRTMIVKVFQGYFRKVVK
jgi:phage gpG-like protein